MRKDPSLASEKFITTINDSEIEISLRPEGSIYNIEIWDKATGKLIDESVFTDSPLPDIYTREDFNQALSIIFADYRDESETEDLVSDSNEIAEWVTAKSLSEIDSVTELRAFLKSIEYVIEDLSKTALYDSIGRTDDSLVCKYGDVIIKVDFRYSDD